MGRRSKAKRAAGAARERLRTKLLINPNDAEARLQLEKSLKNNASRPKRTFINRRRGD